MRLIPQDTIVSTRKVNEAMKIDIMSRWGLLPLWSCTFVTCLIAPICKYRDI